MRSLGLTFALLLLTTSPSLVMMVLHASSQAAGLGFAATGILFMAWWCRGFRLRANVALKQLGVVSLFMSILIVHGATASFVTGAFDWVRALSSMMLAALIYFSAFSLGRTVNAMQDGQIVSAMRICFLIFVAEGVLALLGVPALGHATHHLPVIFFMEPSHYSLAFLPFVTFLVMAERGATRLAVVCIALLLGLLIKSLTLLVGIGIAVILVLPVKHLIVFIVCALPFSVFIETDYFIARLAFSDDVTNLSALAYLQGWERALLNFNWTHGLGVGFQQFGLVGELGEFQERIAQIFSTTESINLLDGGSNGSKLIGEFGVFGGLMLLSYLIITVSRIVRIRRQQTATRQHFVHEYFFAACLLAPFTEFFVRGVGYMSAGMFLLLVGVTNGTTRPSMDRVSGKSQPDRV
jgi:hypothetical protein